uniref:NADH-ubiquinone oxidoreductase chain 1 n=1 Tax=Ceuthomantis smaragdinus TaxID=696019 RepID=D3J006_9NEOB|nr:NADH dehydrogenase 1 [Ceuthomantis smaragdinus]ACZ94009.1 NADH dehydrogenase 1 [Ceuthomantis smaragdinus]
MLKTSYPLHTLFTLTIILAATFMTLLERKFIGSSQNRMGPNTTGPIGVFQPFADALKLFSKETMRPSSSSKFLFSITPAMALFLALILWAPLPMPFPIAQMNLGILFILAMSSLSVYSVLGSGWASNSKFALIGALRAVAQAISYEVALALILLCAVIMSGNFMLQNFNLSQEAMWLTVPLWPLTMMWFMSTIAETNRAPFDLTEGESELVSGFNVEYAGGPFSMFFLAEYANILMMNMLTSIIFLGSSLSLFKSTITLTIAFKTTILSTLSLWIRTTFPRFRYDQLMSLLWKNFLPLSLALILWQITFPVTNAFSPPLF